MSRWEPNAPERLAQAALDLYAERGFEQTTVAEIAKRAGLTERTFFRHFTDKREVLFSGADVMQKLLISAVVDAPAHMSPIDAVATALETVAAEVFEQRRPQSRQRQRIIAQETGLQERELMKLASLASALADGLRRREVAESAAGVAAEVGIVVFKTAFARWIEGERDLPQLLRESLEELRALMLPADQWS